MLRYLEFAVDKYVPLAHPIFSIKKHLHVFIGPCFFSILSEFKALIASKIRESFLLNRLPQVLFDYI